MKNFLLIIFIFCNVASFSQKVVASLSGLNVIYIGLENEIEIVAEAYTTKDLVTKTINAELITKNGKQYIISKKRGEAQLIVGVKKTKDTLWLDTIDFRVRNLPRPKPQLGTLQDGETQSIASIRANANRMYLSYGEGFMVRGLKANVLAYTCTIIDSLGIDSWRVLGSNNTREIKNRISRTAEYGKIIFSDFEYCVIHEKDTIVTPQKLNNEQVIITVRPQSSRFNFLFSSDISEKTREKFIPLYTIEGQFKEVLTPFYYNSLYHFKDYSYEVGIVKIGEWQFFSGIGKQQYLYMQEVYDTLGDLKSFKKYDKSGFNTLNIEFKENADSTYYIERYTNGSIKKEGWVYVSGKKYINLGELSESYHGTMSRNPFRKDYEEMKLIPFGIWNEYHENGKLKLKASFKIIIDYQFYDSYWNMINGNKSTSKGVNSVVDGTWIEYDRKGKEINRWYYKNGYWKEG